MDLKGRYVTFVCRITDPEKYAGENPMNTHQLAGVEVVGSSVGDLMGYSDKLEELCGGQENEAVRAAFEKHCLPGQQRI